MRTQRRTIFAALLLGAALSAPPAWSEGERFLVGVEAGTFEPSGFSDSYDAVYGESLTPIGARFEWAFSPRFALALATSFVSADGEQVAILPDEPPVPTGIPVELELNPWHLTFAWRIHPEGPWSGFVGAGPTLLKLTETSELGEYSSDEIGAHLSAGIRRSFGGFVLGAEAQYSTVPDAIGEAGAAAAFDEDDGGGIAAKLLLGYAF